MLPSDCNSHRLWTKCRQCRQHKQLSFAHFFFYYQYLYHWTAKFDIHTSQNCVWKLESKDSKKILFFSLLLLDFLRSIVSTVFHFISFKCAQTNEFLTISESKIKKERERKMQAQTVQSSQDPLSSWVWMKIRYLTCWRLWIYLKWLIGF